MTSFQKSCHIGLDRVVLDRHNFFNQFHAGHATSFETHAAARFSAENHTGWRVPNGLADHAQADELPRMDAWLSHRDGCEMKADAFSITTAESRGDASITPTVPVLQDPTKTIRDPSGQKNPLHCMVPFDVNVELNHVAESIAPFGRVEHHRQGFSPAAQP